MMLGAAGGSHRIPPPSRASCATLPAAQDLIRRQLWTDELRLQLIAQNGSVQRLPLPEDLKELYKTVPRGSHGALDG